MTLLLCLALIGSQEPVAGANDDYLRAAAIVASAGDELKPVTEGNVLEWAQNATKKYGTALDWIRVGNQKPFETLAGRRQDGDFRELADFRAVGFLYEARVFELIAEIGRGRADIAFRYHSFECSLNSFLQCFMEAISQRNFLYVSAGVAVANR
jgi:hypothetical protein